MFRKLINIKNYLSLSIKLILILSIFNAVYNQLWHIMSANIFLLILMFIPQIIKRVKIIFPKEFEFVLLLFVIATFFVGKFTWAITPIFFGIAIALIGFFITFILYSTNQIKKNSFLILLFSFNFALAFGAGLELIKYYLKLSLGHELSSAIYSYSMTTLTYVALGALISSLIGYIYMKKRLKFLYKIIQKITKLNPDIFSKETNSEELFEMINEGESEKIEFKSTLRINLHTGEKDKRIENSCLKTITAFLNSEGGTLLIGVSNKREILGIEKDHFENNDRFLLHLTNIIKQRIGKKYLSLIKTELISAKNKTIAKIECKKSDKPVFLKTSEGEEFYIRAGPSSSQISGSDLIEYVEKRFKGN